PPHSHYQILKFQEVGTSLATSINELSEEDFDSTWLYANKISTLRKELEYTSNVNNVLQAEKTVWQAEKEVWQARKNLWEVEKNLMNDEISTLERKLDNLEKKY
ncbi:24753_t:CDS:2, partial [Gigaspora margarita]